ncbi:hypothetical protein GCM10009772_27730 [Pseudonocardia alni subsp. carboxydivorans]|uniref:Uncharacterized protein n=1 Tax=Pseudonocardia alni subsp. carboxydivorans TaxID=415010 RepID=A0ABU9AM90_PSEA5
MHDRPPPRAGLIVHGKLRGRSSLPPAVQVTQHHAPLATGAIGLVNLRVGEVTSDGSPASRSPSSAPERVVRERAVPVDRPLTCAARRAGRIRVLDLVDARC